MELLIHDIFVALIGALGLYAGQKLEWYVTTWKCPHCKPPHRFTATSKDPSQRKYAEEFHIRDFHPEVAEKTHP